MSDGDDIKSRAYTAHIGGTERSVQIKAPHFVAGLIVANGRVVRAAPIVHYMLGWDGARVAAYVRSKGWSWV